MKKLFTFLFMALFTALAMAQATTVVDTSGSTIKVCQVVCTELGCRVVCY